MPKTCMWLGEAPLAQHAGGKAANLARVAAMGLSTPESFVVTRAALASFLHETRLQARVSRWLASQPHDDAAFRRLSEEVLATPIPASLREEIARYAEPLLASADHGLAVRSSAVCEDSTRASFAGIFESHLCVRSLGALWRCLQQCWCAAWSPGALSYARRMGMAIASDAMAVLVQETLAPDCAGVAFTADPVTGNPWRLVVNSTFGLLADAIDGRAAADRYVLDWDGGAIVEQQVADKPYTLRPASEGVESKAVPLDMANASSLDAATLETVRAAALAVDRAFDMRMDVEWALTGDRLTIVQARPITALPDFFPYTLSEQDAQRTWHRSLRYWYVPAEVGGEVVAPLFRHIWDAEMWKRAVPEGLPLLSRDCEERDFNGHRYCTEGWSGISPDFFDILEARGEQARLDEILLGSERRLDEIEPRLRRTWDEGKREALESVDVIRAEVARTHAARDLIEPLLGRIGFPPEGNVMGYGAPQSLGALCERMLRRFVREHLSEFPVDELLRGLPSYSHVRVAAAQAFGRSIREAAALEALDSLPMDAVVPTLSKRGVAANFLRELESFCWTFGQCPPSWKDRPPMWTTGSAAWADFSTEILVTIKKAAQGQSRAIEAIQRENRRTRDTAEARILQALPQALRPRLRKLLEWARFWIPVLDDRLWVGGCDHLSRYELLWRVGERLTREGVLEGPHHVFLLRREDLERFRSGAPAELRAAYLANRAEYEKNKRLTAPPHLGAALPSVPAMETPPGDQVVAGATRELTGVGRSPGRTRGRARVAAGLSPAFLDGLTGEHILVCLEDLPFRVDWLAIFLAVRGLVAATDCGAGLHHAAQIARECGVVYVELPREAAVRIADGMLIELDGGEGRVTLVHPD